MNDIEKKLNCGVIAAVKDEDGLAAALETEIPVIFLLKTDLRYVKSTVERVHAKGKSIFLHIDLMGGIGKDEAAVHFLAEQVCPDGIITTKAALIRAAKEVSLACVYRVFLIDSQGLESAVSNVERLKPTAVEIMPGLMPEMVEKFLPVCKNVILGGLVSRSSQVERGLDCGAIAVSTSVSKLWNEKFK